MHRDEFGGIAGKLRVEELEFSLGEMLSAVQDNLNDRAQEKSLDVQVQKLGDLPERLRGDPLRLSQILLNLGANAVKFTSHGDITLRVQSLPSDDATLRLRFEMHDTGIGLAPEHMDRLFQPFEQADVSTTRKYGGTGLGLAICGRLVDLMGGKIGVESQLGVGSTFWFELPFAPVQPRGRHEVSQASGVARAIRAGVPPSQVRLLLVEDDPINQEVATDLLRSKGFEVDVAENGAVGIERTETTQYDAILMDVQMPVMDGLTATRELRKRASSAATPILAMTANAFAEDKAACHDAGMDDFVAKPIQPDAFFATVCRWTGALLPVRSTSMAQLAAPMAADLRERLHQIPGLNVTAGLTVVQGDLHAYERLLRRFCADRADGVAALRADVEAGRWVDAQRAAHTLKGLAATLGADALRRAAAEMETALADDAHSQESLSPKLNVLAGELHTLVADIEACLPSLTIAASGPVNWPEVREATRSLQALLADDDVHALDTFREHAAAFRAALGPAEVDLRRAVESFEFETALELLRAAIVADARLA